MNELNKSAAPENIYSLCFNIRCLPSDSSAKIIDEEFIKSISNIIDEIYKFLTKYVLENNALIKMMGKEIEKIGDLIYIGSRFMLEIGKEVLGELYNAADKICYFDNTANAGNNFIKSYTDKSSEIIRNIKEIFSDQLKEKNILVEPDNIKIF